MPIQYKILNNCSKKNSAMNRLKHAVSFINKNIGIFWVEQVIEGDSVLRPPHWNSCNVFSFYHVQRLIFNLCIQSNISIVFGLCFGPSYGSLMFIIIWLNIISIEFNTKSLNLTLVNAREKVVRRGPYLLN